MAGKKRFTKAQKDYMEKLRDPRWQKKKNGVLERDSYTCTWCRAGLDDGRNLQVHHGYYAPRSAGMEPWDYPDASLFTLCYDCHEQAESLKQELNVLQGHVPPQYQHQVFYFMQELLEALAAGEEIVALPPRNPVKGKAA